MARNAIESDFWTSKMAAGSHFVKKLHKNKNCGIDLNGQKCDRKWISDMSAAILSKISNKNKVVYRSEMARN